MKTISVTQFKAHCLELLNDVARTGEPVMLTKHGKPTAMVVPPPAATGKKWKLGLFSESAKVTGDIVPPLGEPWEVLG